MFTVKEARTTGKVRGKRNRENPAGKQRVGKWSSRMLPGIMAVPGKHDFEEKWA
jgi:hypothetical protein